MRVSARHAHAAQVPSCPLPLTSAQSCAVCDPAPRRGRSRRHPIPLQTQGLLASQPGLRPPGGQTPPPALLQSSEMLQGNLTRAPATSSLSPWSGRSQNEPLNCLVLFFKENHVFTLMPKLQRLTACQLRLSEPGSGRAALPRACLCLWSNRGRLFQRKICRMGLCYRAPRGPQPQVQEAQRVPAPEPRACLLLAGIGAQPRPAGGDAACSCRICTLMPLPLTLASRLTAHAHGGGEG